MQNPLRWEKSLGAGSALAMPPKHPLLASEGTVPVLTGMDATSSCCGSYSRGFWKGLCAAKIQLLSGWVQPGFPEPAITILGQSLESVRW